MNDEQSVVLVESVKNMAEALKEIKEHLKEPKVKFVEKTIRPEAFEKMMKFKDFVTMELYKTMTDEQRKMLHDFERENGKSIPKTARQVLTSKVVTEE